MLEKIIVKKGNSSYVLIPKDLMDMLNIRLGDKVTINVENGAIIIKKFVDNS